MTVLYVNDFLEIYWKLYSGTSWTVIVSTLGSLCA